MKLKLSLCILNQTLEFIINEETCFQTNLSNRFYNLEDFNERSGELKFQIKNIENKIIKIKTKS